MAPAVPEPTHSFLPSTKWPYDIHSVPLQAECTFAAQSTILLSGQALSSWSLLFSRAIRIGGLELTIVMWRRHWLWQFFLIFREEWDGWRVNVCRCDRGLYLYTLANVNTILSSTVPRLASIGAVLVIGKVPCCSPPYEILKYSQTLETACSSL